MAAASFLAAWLLLPGLLLKIAQVQAILAVSLRAVSSNQRDSIVRTSDETAL
jgi:adenine C2-methylase RlmN of 23S rRNA A2503 and tRNA A37